MACCTFDSSVINLSYSEQQVFSHSKIPFSGQACRDASG
jgi:hypothetical protein